MTRNLRLRIVNRQTDHGEEKRQVPVRLEPDYVAAKRRPRARSLFLLHVIRTTRIDAQTSQIGHQVA